MGYNRTKNKQNFNIKTPIKTLFCKGIYYLFKGDSVVYVGMSTKNCMNRINDHFQKGEKKFTHYEIMSMHDKTNDYIKAEEKRRIEKLAPKYNKVHNSMYGGLWLNEEQFNRKHGIE